VDEEISMDRKVETSLFKILDMVKLFRDEQGTLGELARESLADMLVTPPTADEVRAYLDHSDKEAGIMTSTEALAEHEGDDEAINEIWRDVRYDEEPIAEFLSFWSFDGTRQLPGSSGPVWHVTPREYTQ
jgi:hypothetical protein